MSLRRFQYQLSSILVAVACVALVLGAARGDVARVFLMVASAAWVVAAGVVLVCVAVAGAVHSAAGGTVLRFIGLPSLARRIAFERRLARIRPGNTSQFVRRVLGAPLREEGFGDRLYWSYRVAGQRYTVSFDPRRLVAKYSNGLVRDRSARTFE